MGKLSKLDFVTGFAILIILFINETLSWGFNSNKGYDTNKAEKLYNEQCSKCHRKNGTGIKNVYPPLKDADYIKKVDTQELLRGMIYGRSGKITVNNVTYNGVMTTEVDKSLTDNDIALILTYVLQKFNNIDKIVTAEEVVKAKKAGKLPPHK
jgi:mono/diheme cytochrome c family protein